jgi:hypothetical protein
LQTQAQAAGFHASCLRIQSATEDEHYYWVDRAQGQNLKGWAREAQHPTRHNPHTKLATYNSERAAKSVQDGVMGNVLHLSTFAEQHDVQTGTHELKAGHLFCSKVQLTIRPQNTCPKENLMVEFTLEQSQETSCREHATAGSKHNTTTAASGNY